MALATYSCRSVRNSVYVWSGLAGTDAASTALPVLDLDIKELKAGVNRLEVEANADEYVDSECVPVLRHALIRLGVGSHSAAMLRPFLVDAREQMSSVERKRSALTESFLATAAYVFPGVACVSWSGFHSVWCVCLCVCGWGVWACMWMGGGRAQFSRGKA